MGRIWSFQRKDVYKSTCYISLATMAADVKSDRSNVKKRIDKLVELGLLIKSPRGNNKSVEYRLDMTAIAKRRLEVEEARKSNVLRIRRNAKLSGTQSILPSLKGYGFIQPIALFLFLTNYGLNQPTV